MRRRAARPRASAAAAPGRPRAAAPASGAAAGDAPASRRRSAPDRAALVVAIAGRPNAGKSTLFNRLLGGRRAIVDETPGVTRDDNRGVVVREGRVFELVDTGGIEERPESGDLAARVHVRSLAALRAADAIVYLVDGKAGLSAADRAVASAIRRLGVPTVLAVNKIDRADQEARAIDFLGLGLAAPIAVSAAHGLGVGELWERVESLVGDAGRLVGAAADGDVAASAGAAEGHAAGEAAAHPTDDLARPPHIALVGRPNVGKSSLLNRTAGFERALVDALPGTTRDPVDVEIARGTRRYVVVDTAGLRRPSRVVETIESHAAQAAIGAVERAEVVVLVLDATVGVTDQDLRLADLVWRRGRALVVAVNKSDLAPDLAAEQCHTTIARRLPQWPPLPLARVSAREGTGLRTLFAAIDTAVDAYRRRLPTPRLNALVQASVAAHPPPLDRGRPVKLLYATQVHAGPQEIALFAARSAALPREYVRYLTHRLREAFGLVGVPLKLVVRERPRAERRRTPQPRVRGRHSGTGAKARAKAKPGKPRLAPRRTGR